MEKIENRVRKDRQTDLQHYDDRPQKFSLWHIVGGIALVGLATVVLVNLPDVKRYIKISTM